MPAVTAFIAYLTWRWIEAGGRCRRFWQRLRLFLLGFLGLVISNFPYLVSAVTHRVGHRGGAASQISMLLGTLFWLPIVLGARRIHDWPFRGKVREAESYHQPMSFRTAEAPGPESRCKHYVCFWIPGSLASRTPRNDG